MPHLLKIQYIISVFSTDFKFNLMDSIKVLSVCITLLLGSVLCSNPRGKFNKKSWIFLVICKFIQIVLKFIRGLSVLDVLLKPNT